VRRLWADALFAGSDGGAEHWAIIASMVETCKLNDVNPLAYLTDVLTRIVNGHPSSDIDQLLPWAYRRQAFKAVAWKRRLPPDIAAMELFVVPTIGFDLFYVFVIIRLDRRDLVWINVTANPTAEWVAH
jgi:hypothetical protein